VLPPLKEAGDADNLSRAFMALIELTEATPKIFKNLFSSLVKFSISVVQEKDLGDQVRQNALELMATFADEAPAMCKKDPSYASEMVTQCLSLMTDIGIEDDDAAEWNASEDVSVINDLPSTPLTYSSLTLKRAISITSLVSNVWTGLPTNSVARSCSLQHLRGSPA
jgi:hypothetical protein